MAKVISNIPGYRGGTNITRTSQLINDGDDAFDGYKFIKNDIELNTIIEEHVIATGMADKSFTYYSNGPAKTWYVYHGLEKNPSVSVLNTANTEIKGQVNYLSENEVEIKFNNPIEGKAIFN